MHPRKRNIIVGSTHIPIVVDAKVRPPAFRGLVRRRCCELLTGLDDRRLAIVLAPAGFGKTTMLAQFADIAAASGDPVAWYRAEVTDGQPEVALAHLERAMQVAMPGLPGGWRSVTDAAAALECTARERVLLVLDDVHQLIGSGAEAMLARLLELAPPALRIVMASRQAPQFDLSRLRLVDALVEIGPPDLRFRSWETDQLFRTYYEEPLPHEEVTLLTRGIGGWAAGLQLFHLATRGKPLCTRLDAVRQLRGRSGVARDYLARHVVGELPAPLQRFLIDTSVLISLDGRFCDSFLGTDDSATCLQQLARRQLVERDETDGSYQCHDVLRSHLQILFAEHSGEAALRTTFGRAGSLLERSGRPGDAFVAYVGAGDFDALTRLLGRHGERVEPRARLALDELPAAFVDSEPWLLLAAARRDLANGNLAGADAYYRRAAAGFAEGAAPPSFRQERLALGAWLEPRLNPSSSSWVATLRHATRRNPQRAVDALAEDGAASQLARGVAALLAADDDRASSCLAAARDRADASPTVVIAAKLTLAFTRDADAADVTRHADELATAADALDVPALARLARALPALAGSAEAIGDAEAVRAASDSAGDLWGAALASVLCAAGRRRAGDPRAEATLADAAQRLRDLDADAVAAWALRLSALTPSPAEPPTGLPDDPPCTARVRCFGRLVVTVAGRDLTINSVRPRSRSALRILALHAGEALHWEYLAESLWPARTPAGARRSVQVAISELRQWLRAGQASAAGLEIVRDGHNYRLATGPRTAVDVVDFHALRRDAERARRVGKVAGAIASLRAALDLYDDDPFPEEGQDDWVVEARERYRSLAADVAEQLARLLLESGDAKAAAVAAEWGLRKDRFRDALWQVLVSARDLAGEHAAATRARHGYGSVLSELGLSPSTGALTSSTR